MRPSSPESGLHIRQLISVEVECSEVRGMLQTAQVGYPCLRGFQIFEIQHSCGGERCVFG